MFDTVHQESKAFDGRLTVLPSKAHEPAVVSILSFVAMLSLTSTGTPCKMPLALSCGSEFSVLEKSDPTELL